MSNIQLLELNKAGLGRWDEFCLNSDDAWFWHTTKWLDYCVSYGSDKYDTKNMSFYLADGTGALAICPLFIEKKRNSYGMIYNEFSTAGSGGYGIAPALRNDLTEERADKVLKEIFTMIDQLAIRHQVVRALFRAYPLAKRDRYNKLMRYGYQDCSLSTQVLDLSPPLDEIWSGVRKGHKYDIHRGEKNFNIAIYDKNNADKSVFDQYRLLHHKASGRMTRPVETFEMMYNWITSGSGMLCGLSRDGRYAGFSYISLYKDSAYYSSASDDPEFQTDVPISHVIQWSVIKWLKENGFKHYEIGAQQFGPQIYDIPSAKDISISFFKRGFGGRTLPYFRGEKFYDCNYQRLVYGQRMNAFISSGME